MIFNPDQLQRKDLERDLPDVNGLTFLVEELGETGARLSITGPLWIRSHNPKGLKQFSEVMGDIQTANLRLHELLSRDVQASLDWLEIAAGNHRPISSASSLIYYNAGKEVAWTGFGLGKRSPLEYLGSTYTVEWAEGEGEEDLLGLIVITHKGIFTTNVNNPGGKTSMMQRILGIGQDGKVTGTTFNSAITDSDPKAALLNDVRESRLRAYWAAVASAIESSAWLVAPPGSGES